MAIPMAGNATRFVSKHTNNTVEMIPQNANTKITGINTLNEFATAGGILSPNLICNLSICEIVINNSHVIRPMMIPAKSPVVPILLNPKIPDT